MSHIPFSYYDDDDNEIQVRLPARYEVCETCQGAGRHTNRNIDGNGITSSEWAEWTDEEQETYLSGGYDVVCEECSGLRVVLEVDEERCPPELLERYYQASRSEAEDRAEERYWQRLESYACGERD